ncbi:MAG: hypothetical protein P4M00_21015 [Azospirillaceae bacterium]|nr:hypothetical protein [Azospirillaceae bacterium]
MSKISNPADGAISRRTATKLLAAAAAAPLFAAPAIVRAQSRVPDLLLFMMGDVHSGYRYMPGLVSTIKQVLALNPGANAAMLFNGDMHEAGNILSVRNNAAIDFALIDSLHGLMPIVVNIGNHDADIFDPADFVTRMNSRGVTVISNITDRRTGQLFARPMTTLKTSDATINLIGFGTPSLTSYSATYRADFNVPDPGTYAAQMLPSLQTNGTLNIAMAHTGFQYDQAIIPSMTTPFILHGAHDHLVFSQQLGRNYHIHTGYWCSSVTVASVFFSRFGPIVKTTVLPIDPLQAGDPTLQTLITQQKAAYLTSQDLQVIGTMPQALALDQAVLFACSALRQASGADVALLSHTTFGDGLPKGPVTPFDFSAFIRFDGAFVQAVVDGATLAQVLTRTNQFGDFPYTQRTGDYLYASPVTPVAGQQYKIIVNSFAASSAASQQLYFGTTQIQFSAVPNLMLKAVVQAALPQ